MVSGAKWRWRKTAAGASPRPTLCNKHILFARIKRPLLVLSHLKNLRFFASRAICACLACASTDSRTLDYHFAKGETSLLPSGKNFTCVANFTLTTGQNFTNKTCHSPQTVILSEAKNLTRHRGVGSAQILRCARG